ncbi:uncharacterized protein LOC115428223 [Sphaeramia orbicularis]|uniref:uncharacterized protein LOC115428223 n=1 Tax=Sphaeramia orbicularis TaxID=375764 RepID=UPI0011804AF1|nr:uncharacterized protein LOC115428223 [Sphaeramia orbicularis]
MMRMNVYMCLSAFILSCRVCAEEVHMAVMETSSVSLPCSYIMDNSMTWTKLVDGRLDFLVSVTGDEERRENDPGERFSSVGYNSLHINRVYLSDSGKYMCNNHWSVELTVIPTGTFIQHARKGTSVTLTCPHVTGSYDLIWRRESDGWGLHPGLTLTLTDLRLSDSGLFSCDGKPAVYLNVTTGDDEAPPTTTDTKMTSTSATTATTQTKTTSKTNNSKKGTKPEKKGGKKTKPTKKPEVKPTTTASITVTKGGSDKITPPSPSVPRPTNSPKTPIKSTPRMVTASTQTKDDAPEHLPPHFGLVYRVMLVSVLVFFVLCCSFRLWFIKRGVKRSREGTTEYDTVNITGDAAENDSMDDDITDLHISENMTDTI